MARRSHKTKRGDLIFKVVACIAVAVLLLLVLRQCAPKKSAGEEGSNADISAEQAASAHVGNRGAFIGTVEDIRTVDNNRVVCVRLKGDGDKYVPLLILKGTEANIFRNKTYKFKYECRSGSSPDGEVKGVFIVTEVESQS